MSTNARNIDSPARECAVCGQKFAQGDSVRSFLLDAGKAYERVDVLAEKADAFKAAKPVICRWDWLVKPRDNRAREEARSALEQSEAMLLALCEGETPESVDADELAALKQLLALMLQRKRILRPSADADDVFIHTSSGTRLHCPPPANMSEELLRKAAAQLMTV